MKNETYNQLAALTLSDKFHCTLPEQQQLLHAAIGLQTEVGELFAAVRLGQKHFYQFDRVNFLEEIGDAAWYLSIPQRILAFDIEKYDSSEFTRVTMRDQDVFGDDLYHLNQNTTEFLDIIKKQTFYGRNPKQEDVQYLLGQIYTGLRLLTNHVRGDWNTVLKNNIDKLAARYEGAFSEFLANNRDLAAEYTILARSK